MSWKSSPGGVDRDRGRRRRAPRGRRPGARRPRRAVRLAASGAGRSTRCCPRSPTARSPSAGSSPSPTCGRWTCSSPWTTCSSSAGSCPGSSTRCSRCSGCARWSWTATATRDGRARSTPRQVEDELRGVAGLEDPDADRGALARFDVEGPGLVQVLPIGPETVVDGSAPTVAGLAATGALEPARPLFYAADRSPAQLRAAAEAGADLVIGDSGRLRVNVPAQTRQEAGATVSAAGELPPGSAELQPFPDAGTEERTVAEFDGVRDVREDVLPAVRQFPEQRPFAALDGDEATSWVAPDHPDESRHWLEVEFDAPRDVPRSSSSPMRTRRDGRSRSRSPARSTPSARARRRCARACGASSGCGSASPGSSGPPAWTARPAASPSCASPAWTRASGCVRRSGSSVRWRASTSTARRSPTCSSGRPPRRPSIRAAGAACRSGGSSGTAAMPSARSRGGSRRPPRAPGARTAGRCSRPRPTRTPRAGAVRWWSGSAPQRCGCAASLRAPVASGSSDAASPPTSRPARWT